MTNTTTHYNTIVLGIGGMGSATLYHLAKRGQKVLGIERFQIPHEMGSSHGLTRIIRLAYYEDPSYVPLLRRAYELWNTLESEVDERLLTITGSIDAGAEDDEVFAGSLKSCLEHDLPHEVLDSQALSQRFPGYQFPSHIYALFQPQGGFLIPESCIESHVHVADLLTDTQVLDWEPTTNGVTVRTAEQTFTADKLVITAGAWANKLLPILQNKTIAERQVLIWLAIQSPEIFTPERFPVFNCSVEEGRFYGFPEVNPTGKTPGFKYGRWHHLDEQVDPDDFSRLEVHQRDEDILRGFAERYFPQASGETLSMKACIFTNSPDEHFIMDTHPDHPQVSFASGMTGHGFKFCSVIGEIMADLSQHGQTTHNIDILRLNRSMA